LRGASIYLFLSLWLNFKGGEGISVTWKANQKFSFRSTVEFEQQRELIMRSMFVGDRASASAQIVDL
jgi:hypothetical protein